MSKKNRYRQRDREERPRISTDSAPRNFNSDASASHAAEYKVVRSDLVRLIILNGFVFAAVIILYYSNAQSGYLERMFERFF